MIARGWRRGVVLATVVAAVVAGVLLTLRPWGGEDDTVEQAAADVIEYRLCDVVVEAPPPAVVPGQTERLVVGRAVSRSGEPRFELQIRGTSRSRVFIDPMTGTLLAEHYETATQQAVLQEILQTLRVEPLDASSAPWPYTNAVQIPARHLGGKDAFGYRPPDPGSGLVVSKRTVDGIGWFSESLRVTNCRSAMEIEVKFPTGAEPDVTVTRDIHPQDEAAFEALDDQVTVDVER